MSASKRLLQTLLVGTALIAGAAQAQDQSPTAPSLTDILMKATGGKPAETAPAPVPPVPAAPIPAAPAPTAAQPIPLPPLMPTPLPPAGNDTAPPPARLAPAPKVETPAPAPAPVQGGVVLEPEAPVSILPAVPEAAPPTPAAAPMPNADAPPPAAAPLGGLAAPAPGAPAADTGSKVPKPTKPLPVLVAPSDINMDHINRLNASIYQMEREGRLEEERLKKMRALSDQEKLNRADEEAVRKGDEAKRKADADAKKAEDDAKRAAAPRPNAPPPGVNATAQAAQAALRGRERDSLPSVTMIMGSGGIYRARLVLSNGGLLVAAKGDTLPGGYRITDITATSVSAAGNSKEVYVLPFSDGTVRQAPTAPPGAAPAGPPQVQPFQAIPMQ